MPNQSQSCQAGHGWSPRPSVSLHASAWRVQPQPAATRSYPPLTQATTRTSRNPRLHSLPSYPLPSFGADSDPSCAHERGAEGRWRSSVARVKGGRGGEGRGMRGRVGEWAVIFMIRGRRQREQRSRTQMAQGMQIIH